MIRNIINLKGNKSKEDPEFVKQNTIDDLTDTFVNFSLRTFKIDLLIKTCLFDYMLLKDDVDLSSECYYNIYCDNKKLNCDTKEYAIIALMIKCNFNIDDNSIYINNYTELVNDIENIFKDEIDNLYKIAESISKEAMISKFPSEDLSKRKHKRRKQIYDFNVEQLDKIDTVTYKIEHCKFTCMARIMSKIYDYSNTKFMQYVMKPDDMIDAKSARTAKVVSRISHKDNK